MYINIFCCSLVDLSVVPQMNTITITKDMDRNAGVFETCSDLLNQKIEGRAPNLCFNQLSRCSSLTTFAPLA